MTSFATHRLRVHDTSLPAHRRLSALRTCVVSFAPYGFRATYHHLCRSARIPVRLTDDPASLVRAVEELHAARGVWLVDEAAFVERRRREKARGLRERRPDGGWRDQGRGWEGSLAFCPDPGSHPDEPLPVVVERILRSFLPSSASVSASSSALECRVCSGDHGTTAWRSAYDAYRLCARCGVALRRSPAAFDPALAAAERRRWKAIWKRTWDHV
ncbi:hypothetical protein [Streptomyces sp. NPDC053048]|uniref:hypothetical protein n=1 Tax=Streptomyces sp. NPDC053048 TaxID=3365694 RepID=UPI0037D2E39C